MTKLSDEELNKIPELYVGWNGAFASKLIELMTELRSARAAKGKIRGALERIGQATTSELRGVLYHAPLARQTLADADVKAYLGDE